MTTITTIPAAPGFWVMEASTDRTIVHKHPVIAWQVGWDRLAENEPRPLIVGGPVSGSDFIALLCPNGQVYDLAEDSLGVSDGIAWPSENEWLKGTVEAATKLIQREDLGAKLTGSQSPCTSLPG